MSYPQGVDMAAAIAAGFVLDRREAVPAVMGRHEDFLFGPGLAGTARATAALTQDGAHIYTMAGAMGGAAMIGLGLALARPANLAIVCVDNGHYGETGYQKSHTSLGVDLEKIAIGSGIKMTRTISRADEIADGARLLRAGNGTAFVLLRGKPTDPPGFKRNMDAASVPVRFKTALSRTDARP